MIITLTGENSFAIADAERRLADAFVAKHGANGVEHIDAEELTAARLPDLLQGATLFAPNRLVIIKNLAANKAISEPLTNALASVADGTTIVIADSTLDKRTKLYKFLKEKSNFKVFSPLSETQLVHWAQAEAVRTGGALEAAEAAYLINRTNGDQWRLAQEIVKLVSYQPQITKQTIAMLVESSPEGTAFDVLDAAFAGKNTEVARLIADLRVQEDPYKFFGLIASQVHALAVIAAAGGRSPDVIAKDAGLHPFVVRKTQSIAKRLGSTRIAQMAAEVAQCDYRLKSTGGDPWELLQLCLQKIVQSAAQQAE